MITPLLFAGIIYFLGNLPILFLSSFIPFLASKEYIFIFLFFIFSLKFWSKKRWHQENIWLNLGFKKLKDNFYNLTVRKEIYKSFVIIIFWCFLLIIFGYLKFKTSINYNFLFDILFTAFFVGVAEELLFRVWLFEELNLFLNKKHAILVQSIIFSITHPYNFDENLLINLLMKIGLFLLGLYLNLLRLNNYPNIFPSIAFHGGIVGFIFLAKSILEIKINYPSLIYGIQYDNFINPVGGFIGLFTLLILNFNQIKRFYKREI